MAIVIVITRTDNSGVLNTFSVDRNLVLGNSIYCDVVLQDKTIANMQCQIQQAKTGHIVITNLDSKKEVLLNQSKFKKAALKVDDVIQIGAFILQLDHEQLTADEMEIFNTEYEEFV